MLGVSQPTLSAWEGERKNPSVESLIQMSELYGVSVDFLLGLPEARYHRADMLQPIPPEALPAFHDTPVFSSRYGWAMVNAIEGELLLQAGRVCRWQMQPKCMFCLRPLQHPARQ